MPASEEAWNAEFFAFWAGDQLARWTCLVGASVVHTGVGRGVVLSVKEQRPSRALSVSFRGEDAAKTFLTDRFETYFRLPTLPAEAAQDVRSIEAFREARTAGQELKAQEERRAQESARKAAERKAQGAREAEARSEFSRLRQTYDVVGFLDESPSSPLFAILKKLEDDEGLADADLDWLEGHSLHPILASWYEKQYQATRNPGMGAKASSEWRDAGLPRRALGLPRPSGSADPKGQAAFYTSQAAAHADLGQVDRALQLARKAVQLNPRSYHPHKLLGRIHYLQGDPSQGEMEFETAVRLGADRAQLEGLRRAAVRDSPDRISTARYLLQKDPKKYAWARAYLTRGDPGVKQ